MKILKTLLIMLSGFILFSFTISSFAEGKGHDASMSGGAMPPGLQNKEMPHGLEKQNKTPYGWSQGKKVGWEHHMKGKHHKHKKHHINFMNVNHPNKSGKKD